MSGKHSDLAARALVAFEQDIPIETSVANLGKELGNQHSVLLKPLILHEDPLEIKEWNKDVIKWPNPNLGNISSYILEKSPFDLVY